MRTRPFGATDCAKEYRGAVHATCDSVCGQRILGLVDRSATDQAHVKLELVVVDLGNFFQGTVSSSRDLGADAIAGEQCN
jgi:hypothetical protein